MINKHVLEELRRRPISTGSVRLMLCGHCRRFMCAVDADRPYCPECNPVFGKKKEIDYLHPADLEALKLFVDPIEVKGEIAYGVSAGLMYYPEYVNQRPRDAVEPGKPARSGRRIFSVVAPTREQAESDFIAEVRGFFRLRIQEWIDVWEGRKMSGAVTGRMTSGATPTLETMKDLAARSTPFERSTTYTERAYLTDVALPKDAYGLPIGVREKLKATENSEDPEVRKMIINILVEQGILMQHIVRLSQEERVDMICSYRGSLVSRSLQKIIDNPGVPAADIVKGREPARVRVMHRLRAVHETETMMARKLVTLLLMEQGEDLNYIRSLPMDRCVELVLRNMDRYLFGKDLMSMVVANTATNRSPIDVLRLYLDKLPENHPEVLLTP